MVIINDIYAFLNEIAPVRYQMDFDNAGFLVGDGGAAVKKALLALDITDAVIAEAARAAHCFAPPAHLYAAAARDDG